MSFIARRRAQPRFQENERVVLKHAQGKARSDVDLRLSEGQRFLAHVA